MRLTTRLAPIALLAAALTTTGTPADAQRSGRRHSDPAVQESPRTRAFFGVGWRQVDVDALNVAMAAAGYPDVAEDFVSVGGGVQLISGRVALGIEGHGLLGTDAEVSRDTFDAHLSGGYGMLSLGISAIASPRVRLTPTGSIGYGGMTLEIAEAGRFSFDELLVEPRRGARVTQGSFLLGAGLGIELLVPWRQSSTGARSISVGVDGGYTFAPFTTRWKLYESGLNTASVTGGPDVGIEGAHARVSIGITRSGRR